MNFDKEQFLNNEIQEVQKTFEGKIDPEYIDKYMKATAEWLDDVSDWSIRYVDWVEDWFSGYGANDLWLDFADNGIKPFGINKYEEVFNHHTPLTNYGDNICQFIDKETMVDNNIQDEDLREDFLEEMSCFENTYYTKIQRCKIDGYITDINNTMEQIDKACKHLIEDDNFFVMDGIDAAVYEELYGREEYALRDYFEICVLHKVPSAKDLIASDNFFEEFQNTTYDYYSDIDDVLHEAIEELNLKGRVTDYNFRIPYDWYVELTPELENKVIDAVKEIISSEEFDYNYADEIISADLDNEYNIYHCYTVEGFAANETRRSLKNKQDWENLGKKIEQEILRPAMEKKSTMKM